ncbi:MAG: SDR family oxidoreductase [Muribaculaceae bacterium]|nr:SDR family oxidoreductase [Muribaculaceae bacterium]
MNTVSHNPFSLEGKTILVTGASSGIGQQCAIDCSRMGAKVAILGRNHERLRETLSRLEGEGNHAYAVELTDDAAVKDTVSEVVADMGRLDGVVNCAGISGVFPLKLMSEEKIMEFLRNNVVSALSLTRECLRKKNFSTTGGSVIFFSSVMGVVGEKAKSLYGLTKGALIAASRGLACEFADRKVRVNSISPGAIVTPINSKLPYMADPEARAILESRHPLGLGETSDISNGVIYLLSDASRWVTGQNLIIDGGYTAQ